MQMRSLPAFQRSFATLPLILMKQPNSSSAQGDPFSLVPVLALPMLLQCETDRYVSIHSQISCTPFLVSVNVSGPDRGVNVQRWILAFITVCSGYPVTVDT